MNKPVNREQIKNTSSEWTHNVSKALLSSKWHKIVFVSSAVFMLGVILLLFIGFSIKVKSILKEQVETQLLEVALQTRDVVEYKLNQSTMSMYGLSSAISKYESFEDPMLKDLLFRETTRNGFLDMVVILADGTSAQMDNIIPNASQHEFFKLAMNGVASVSDVITSESVGQPIIVSAVPIFKNSKVVGVLCSVQSLKQFEGLLATTAFNDKCYTYVVSETGEIIFSPLNPIAPTSITNLLDISTATEAERQIALDDAKNRRSDVRTFTQADGSEKFAAYAPLDGINNWYTVSIVSSDVLTKKTYYIVALTAVLLGIISVILTIIALYAYYVKRSSQKTFEYIAFTDEVTGSPSWSRFEIDTCELLKKHKDKRYAFVYQNIKNFKYINDILGHEIGNDLLRYVAKVVNDNLTGDEIFSRIIADRFVILIEYTNDASIIKRLDQIDKEIMLFHSNYDVNFALNLVYGIYKIKDITLPINVISDRSLLAMETLCGSNDTKYGFYNSSIRQKALLEKELENEMHEALDNKDFIVYLQPKFDLTTNKIVGAEALVRWLHAKRGLLPPGNFIEIFENNGFITKLDKYMFEETCKLLRKWIDSGKEPVPISVNLSKVHLYNPNIAEDLHSLALRYDIPPSLIEVELTESMDFENMTMLLGVVNRLKHFDFVISIDDFGSGYSSLNLLKDLPVDVLKIDREFLSAASDQKRGRQVIASIIDMAKRLEMKTVAEGVEYREQADFLMAANCDFVQGFFFSQPITINDFESKYIYN